MHKGSRTLGLGLLLAVVAGLIPGTAPLTGAPESRAAISQVAIPPKIEQIIQSTEDPTGALVDVDFSLEPGSDITALKQAISRVGGQITLDEKTYLRGKIPPAAAALLSDVSGVKGLGVNEIVGLAPTQAESPARQPNRAEAPRAVETSLAPMGLRQFQREMGVSGTNVIVAVIDSGVDPGHPDLQLTPDGRPKIVDWKDFTREGKVNTPQEVSWGGTYTTPEGREYQLPQRPDVSGAARFGYLEEHFVDGYINQDLDRNGLKIDRFGVLTVDSRATGQYDSVYVDTNNDGSFRDERLLGVYRDRPEYASLGQYREGSLSERRLNFVVADVDPEGRFAQLGFDSHGHGTWVSGVLGAHNSNGYQGAAAGVQIMALKVLRSTSGGDWFDIKDAIQYAAAHGANIINVSIGDLASGAAKVFDSGASEWLNQIASQYGVLIVLAAGNNGPGLSSGSTIGSPSAVIAAGGYFSPDMWQRDYGWVVPHETVWFFSGTGPRSDGTYLPSVIAPAGSPAPSPLWRDATGYVTATGTSVATPHVAAAAALLMEAGRKAGISHDWKSIKLALEMGARRIPGFEAYEQGHGLIQLMPAFQHLQQISAGQDLRAGTPDGGSGVLARSFSPGSTWFYLTSSAVEPTRVGIYSSESWVRVGLSSLLLPPGVRRQMPLAISPPPEPGAHSAFLTVTQQNKYGPSLILPVTHVQPRELTLANGYEFATTETLEVGRYRRYFFQVPLNATGLNVTAQVPGSAPVGERGTVQVHVFRPDGQVVHVGKVGVGADGTTSLFQTGFPVSGVWEVVVVALPASDSENTTPRFSLKTELVPGALGNQTLKFSVPAGSVTTVPVRVTNVFGAFTGNVDAIGLAKVDTKKTWNASLPWRVQAQSTQLIEKFELNEFTSELQIDISNPTRSDINVPLSSDTDLTLSLYRLLPNADPELRALSAHPGVNNESIRASLLPAGTYWVVVTSASSLPLQFQYRRLMGVDNFNLKVRDESRRHGVGDTWTADLTIQAPATPGRYSGHVLLREGGGILAWYPIEISVGEPALSVTPMAAQLSKGRPTEAVLEIRDARSQALVSDVPVTVNGQRFLSRNGQVLVPVVPQSDTLTLKVEADVPGYQFVNESFLLPVKDVWGQYPLGIDQNEENSSWRRKVMTQLP